MSDIFENDIESEVDFSKFEDTENFEEYDSEEDDFVYPENLYLVRLEYSCEGVYVILPKNIKELIPGQRVILATRYGRDLALVLGKTEHAVGLKKDDIVMIDRVADENDLKKFEDLKEKEAEAFKIFKEKVVEHNLDMKLVAVHFLLEEPKALFFFSSDNRVDFRELVRDLVSVFKMRIELRQIGVRDESRITGGLGVCGRPYCCHSISDKLPPVSIKMAKEQGLSLNSMKISGQCGRLLCCLSYEYNWYAEARRTMPSEGLHLYYDGTNFRITDVNPLKRLVKMIGEDGRLLEIPVSRFEKRDGKWRIN